MSKLFDALTRSLLEKYPADWLNQLGLIHGEPVRVMNSDLSAVTAEADKVIRVEGPTALAGPHRAPGGLRSYTSSATPTVQCAVEREA